METTITINQETATLLKAIAQAKGVSEDSVVKKLVSEYAKKFYKISALVDAKMSNVKFRFRDKDDDNVYTYLRWEWQTYTVKGCDAISGKESMQTSRKQVVIYSDENGNEYVCADPLNYVRIEVLW
jgi:hypothetical protein